MSDINGGGALATLRSRLPKIFTRPIEGSGIASVLRSAKSSHPKLDFSVVEKAFVIASKAHEGHIRKSGDPYITHPIAVAQLLALLTDRR